MQGFESLRVPWLALGAWPRALEHAASDSAAPVVAFALSA